MRQIKYIIIHCTGTRRDSSIDALKRYWKNELGWKNPGYHFIVDGNGKGRHLLDVKHIANGAKGYNTNSIHLAYMGGENEYGETVCTLTSAQSKAICVQLAEWVKLFPQAKIVGHRDISHDANNDGVITPDEWEKQCPCFYVEKFVESYKLHIYGKD